MAHCERGDEYIVGSEAHTYKFEGGGAAVLGSIQPQPVPQQPTARCRWTRSSARSSRRAIRTSRARACWRWRTPGTAACCRRTTCVEAGALARRHGLGFHLDGARLFNAAVASGVPPREIARDFDSVSVCFSKGLGAPVGSVLLGARRWSSARGAGARSSAAAGARPACWRRWPGMRSTTTSRAWPRTTRARNGLPRRCARCPASSWTASTPTWSSSPCPRDRVEDFAAHLQARAIRVALRGPVLRLVTHLDVDDAALERAIGAFRDFFR